MPTIPARVHGRYELRLPVESGPELLLVGFHGYGETAEKHLAELTRIPGAERWALCAVDALHPFYTTKTNEIVRSWMTRADRELAIEDNVAYVRAVVGRIRPEVGWKVPLAWIGFSQGAAMAWRAAAFAGHRAAALVTLGGDVPPDVAGSELAHLPPVLLARGARDDWYTAEKLAHDVGVLRERGVQVEPLTYDGGHAWTDDLRAAASRFLGRVERRGA